MANRAVLGCVDEVCHQIMDKPTIPFGGKIVILLSDFRQTCPVIRQGTCAQVVSASIRSSLLWPHFDIHHLIVPICNIEDIPFANMVDNIGDGAGPNIDLPMMHNVLSSQDLIDFVFPNDTICSPILCPSRAILAPTNAQVDTYNNEILTKLPGEERTYIAADSLEECNDVLQNAQHDDNILLPTLTLFSITSLGSDHQECPTIV
jgi:ATP-dependent DNA helicase PIF1